MRSYFRAWQHSMSSRSLLRGLPHPVPIRRIGLSAVLFAVVVLWVLVQNATWTPAGWQHPIWQLAADALGQEIAGSISVDRDLTALALLQADDGCKCFLVGPAAQP